LAVGAPWCPPCCSWGPSPPSAATPSKACHERLLTAGKPKLAAVIAVARKLLIILNAIAGSGQPWRHADI
jgi:hypothetical protein